MTVQASAPNLRQKRKLDNRMKLIEATIAVIAESGISGVTVSRVVDRAGLSRGLINLHFDTKDAMLAETMQSLALEWEVLWREEAQHNNANKAETLANLLTINLEPPVFGTQKLATWNCFFSDPKYREVYREYCHGIDQAYLETLAALCQALDREGEYGLGDPLLLARTLRSLTGGLWLELMTEPDLVSVEETRLACRLVLSRFFPKHMDAPESGTAARKARSKGCPLTLVDGTTKE